MKKFGLLILAITMYAAANCQQKQSLSDFLDRDLTQVFQDHIDSLTSELFKTNDEYRKTQMQLNDLNDAAQTVPAFLFLLHKLNDSLPLNEADSTLTNLKFLSPGEPVIITIFASALQLVTTSDSLYLNNFPNVQRMIKNGQLIIQPNIISSMTAPVIELPPMPAATGSNKKLVANAWMNYIYTLSARCQDAMQQLDTYFKKEKTKVPDGNLTDIIKLRQKFSLFIIENYCKK